MEAHTIKFPELFKTARSFTIVCKGRRCGEVIKIRRWGSGPSHLVFLLVYGRHIGCIWFLSTFIRCCLLLNDMCCC